MNHCPVARKPAIRLGSTARLAIVACCAALTVSACVNSASPTAAAPSTGSHSVRNGPISFTRFDPRGSHLYTVAPSGGPEHRLSDDAGVQAHSAWSPSGTVVSYTQVNVDGSSINTMNADGGNVTSVLTGNPWALVPSWSPDGMRLAFTSNATGDYQVYTMGADGSDVTQVTHAPSGTTYVGPKYSPDGRQFAVALHRPQDPKDVQDLWVMGITGSNLKRLTNGMNNAESRTWSPDGKQIAFNAVVRGIGQIFVINADGTGLRQLTHNPGTTPAFAPGGIFPTMRGDVTPAWSPDGTRIAYASDIGGNFDIYTMKPDGSDVVQVTRTPQQELSVGWSPRPGN